MRGSLPILLIVIALVLMPGAATPLWGQRPEQHRLDRPASLVQPPSLRSPPLATPFPAGRLLVAIDRPLVAPIGVRAHLFDRRIAIPLSARVESRLCGFVGARRAGATIGLALLF